MEPSRIAPPLLSGLLLVALAPAQATTVVSGGGAALQNAIAAAAPGDTLVVTAGTYDHVLVTRAVSLLCDPGVVIEADRTALLAIAVEIDGLPPGEVVAIRGGALSVPAGPLVPFALRIGDAAGVVVLDDVSFVAGPSGAGVTIERSAAVTMNRCSGMTSVGVEDSRVGLADCTVPSAPSGLAGVRVVRGHLSVAGGTIHGPIGTRPYYIGGPGIEMSQTSRVELAGAVVVRSGSGLGGTGTSITAGSSGGPPGTLLLGPRASTPHGIWSTIPQRHEPLPDVQARSAAPGTTFTVTTSGTPGLVTATVLSLSVLPIPLGGPVVWVDPFAPVIDLGVLPATGQRTVGIPVPPLPRPLPLTLQAVSWNGTLVLGPPTSVVIG